MMSGICLVLAVLRSRFSSSTLLLVAFGVLVVDFLFLFLKVLVDNVLVILHVVCIVTAALVFEILVLILFLILVVVVVGELLFFLLVALLAFHRVLVLVVVHTDLLACLLR